MTIKSEQAKGLEEAAIQYAKDFVYPVKGVHYDIQTNQQNKAMVELLSKTFQAGANFIQSQPGMKQWVSEGKSLGKNNHLAPCPFCGGIEGENVLLGLRDQFFRVSCWSCGFHIEHDRKDKAIAEWNMRNGVTWIEQNLPNSTTTPKSDMVSKDEMNRRLMIASEFSKGIMCIELLKLPAELLIKYNILDADQLAIKIDNVHNPLNQLPEPKDNND